MKRKWSEIKAGDRVVVPVTESVLGSRGNQLISIDDYDPMGFNPVAEVEVYDDLSVELEMCQLNYKRMCEEVHRTHCAKNEMMLERDEAEKKISELTESAVQSPIIEEIKSERDTLDSLLKEAVEFVRMAADADTSDGEYRSICLVCQDDSRRRDGEYPDEGKHTPDCRLAAWLKKVGK